MDKRIFLMVIFAALLSVSVYAGGDKEAAHADEHGDEHGAGEMPDIDPVKLKGRKLRVIATTTIIGDVVREAAGDAAEVTVLMKLGQSPHAYSPSPRDVAALEEADIIFVNGLNFEENLTEVLESMDDSLVVSVSAGIEPIEAFADEHDEHGDEDGDHDEDEDDHGDEDDDHDEDEDDHGDEDDDHGDDDDHKDEKLVDEHGHDISGGDPHFWFSPLNVVEWTENIEYALGAADPANAAKYEESADAYVAKLKALDADIREAVSKIPESDRKLVMDHQVAGYFARDYGFEIIGNILPSISDQAEPSAQELAELTKIIREENIKAIFVGETAGSGMLRLAEAVAAEVGRKLAVSPILTGSLAESGMRGSTYLDFARYNTENIVGALLGLSS